MSGEYEECDVELQINNDIIPIKGIVKINNTEPTVLISLYGYPIIISDLKIKSRLQLELLENHEVKRLSFISPQFLEKFGVKLSDLSECNIDPSILDEVFLKTFGPTPLGIDQDDYINTLKSQYDEYLNGNVYFRTAGNKNIHLSSNIVLSAIRYLQDSIFKPNSIINISALEIISQNYLDSFICNEFYEFDKLLKSMLVIKSNLEYSSNLVVSEFMEKVENILYDSFIHLYNKVSDKNSFLQNIERDNSLLQDPNHRFDISIFSPFLIGLN